jgi:lipopolysaccharide/colanic/teichoic acid biosynthesis glycosyltransferase
MNPLSRASGTYQGDGAFSSSAPGAALEPGMGSAVVSVAKRLIDGTGAACGLVLLAPLMIVIAATIRLDSPGPIIFRQLRLGRGGRPFWFLKFRTMRSDAELQLPHLEEHNESASGILFKMRHDPRVTRVGRFLRQSSLDELPQLLNVLRGEMSLVGPRPLQIRDCERLRVSDPHRFSRRLAVPQGLTGAWQVGGRSEVDCEGMLDLDTDYVDRWSLWLDLRIICRTVLVVLTGRGAW